MFNDREARFQSSILLALAVIALSWLSPGSADAIIFAGGDITPTYNGTDDPWNVGGTFYVGDTGWGSMFINAGSEVISDTAYLGNGSTALGEAVLSGTGSIWTSTGDLYIAHLGRGSILIEDGAAVYNDHAFVAYGGDNVDATGIVTVTGDDSLWDLSGWLYVGGWPDITNQSEGTINVSDSAILNSNSAYIGFGATGHANITGPDSQLNTEFDFVVGFYSQGNAHISGGGQVTARNTTLGVEDGRGSVTVTGADSKFINTSGVQVGRDGEATFTVADSAQLMARYIDVGTLDGFRESGEYYRANGEFTVTGSGSVVDLSSFAWVGSWADGDVRVEQGGQLNTPITLVGLQEGGVGNIVITDADSVWHNTGSFYVGGVNSEARGQGTVDILNQGTLLVDDTLKLWDNGTVNLAGGHLRADTIDDAVAGNFQFTAGTLAVVNFIGDLNHQGGTLAPGSSPGTTTVTGDYSQQSGAILELEIDDTASGQFDRLVVNGEFDAAGTIEVVLGYAPVTGDTFDLVDADTFIDNGYTFDFTAAVLTDGLAWDTSAFASDGVLSVLLSGDFDDSGDVGQDDLDLVLNHWGDVVVDYQAPDAAWVQAAQVTGGVIGQDELAVVLQNWGNTAAIEAELDAIGDATGLSDEQVRGLIPEPGTAAVMIGFGLMGLRRQIKRVGC